MVENNFESLVSFINQVDKFSHDIKTPLSTISGYIQLMSGKFTDGSVEKSRLKVINEELNKIIDLVNKLDQLNLEKKDKVNLP